MTAGFGRRVDITRKGHSRHWRGEKRFVLGPYRAEVAAEQGNSSNVAIKTPLWQSAVEPRFKEAGPIGEDAWTSGS